MDFVALMLVSLNPLDWFGLTPIESLLDWAWPKPEPEGFHPAWTLGGLLKLVLLAAGASLAGAIIYRLLRLRSGGGGGPGPSGTNNSREPMPRRYTERTGRRRR